MGKAKKHNWEDIVWFDPLTPISDDDKEKYQ